MFSELYEGSKQTFNPWIFEHEYPGQRKIFDGRTKNSFKLTITGKLHIFKLINQVDDRLHKHFTTHYVLIT